jgi:hypothetical protein
LLLSVFLVFFFVGFVCILFEGLVFLWGKILGLGCSSVGEGVCVYLRTEERERETHTHTYGVVGRFYWGAKERWSCRKLVKICTQTK